jgi:quercetin dioxygenase-like cupin family protein
MATEAPTLITLVRDTPLEPGSKEGVSKRVVADTPTLSVTEYFWDKDHETVGDHAHDWDTANFIVSGTFEVKIGGRTEILRAGDSYTIPKGTPRGMKALEAGSYILVMSRGHSHD